MNITRKQVTFDLLTNDLKIYYPNESWNNAYYDIKRFMLDNGFHWQEGSVYVSDYPMTAKTCSFLLTELIKTYPWLNKCMRDCRQANIGKDHSMNHLFDKDAMILTREDLLNKEKNLAVSNASLSEMKESIENVAAKQLNDIHEETKMTAKELGLDKYIASIGDRKKYHKSETIDSQRSINPKKER